MMEYINDSKAVNKVIFRLYGNKVNTPIDSPIRDKNHLVELDTVTKDGREAVEYINPLTSEFKRELESKAKELNPSAFLFFETETSQLSKKEHKVEISKL